MAVAVGTDRVVEELTRVWLNLNDPQDPEIFESELESENIIEVSLEELNNVAVDVISVVESELDDLLWMTNIDPEQFLPLGMEDELKYGIKVYKQGMVRVRG